MPQNPDIDHVLARFEQALDGKRPVLHGIGFPSSVFTHDGPDSEPVFVEVDGVIRFVVVNERDHLVPAAALATVAGWRRGTGSFRVSQDQLAAAIELLAAAEACTDVQDPNVVVWREIHQWHWSGGGLIAVFDADPDVPSADPYVLALRALVRSGRQAVPAGEVHSWAPPDGSHPLQGTWDARWPQVVPFSHHLRSVDDHWVRFHSLPDAKRYADDDGEHATVLHRHNTVLGELAQPDENLQVITLELAFTPVPQERTVTVVNVLPDAECWSVLSWPHLDPELAFVHAYVSRITWQVGCLDDLLRLVADDQIAHVIIGPADLSWLYAPYDGGADILQPTASARDDLRERHREWLSAHATGL